VNGVLEDSIRAFKLLTTRRVGRKVAGALLRGLHRVRIAAAPTLH